jgi:hypothetical protein
MMLTARACVSVFGDSFINRRIFCTLKAITTDINHKQNNTTRQIWQKKWNSLFWIDDFD